MRSSESTLYITYAVFVDGEWRLENLKSTFTSYGSFVSVDCDSCIEIDIYNKFKKECRYVLVDKCMLTTYGEENNYEINKSQRRSNI